MRTARLAIVAAALGAAAVTAAHSQSRPIAGTEDPDNWPMYHRSYDGWRYSPLDQINTDNVDDLVVAWVHQPGTDAGGMFATEAGLQATPLAIDGIIYYSAARNRVFALDGTTGREIWHHFPKLADYVDSLLFAPWSRGVTVAQGMVFMGTLDGRAIALDMKTGAEVWQTQLTDTEVCNCNFNSPPVLAKDKLIFGPTGGELFYPGRIYAVEPKTGAVVWEFETLKDDPASWGGDSRRYGGGGAWMPGAYDPETGLVYWGISNPAPDHNGAIRPGDNLYTSSVIALDPDTAELKWYHQEVPHDVWDFDAALGEILIVPHGDERRIVHMNKGGFVFVYRPETGAIDNIWRLAKNITWVEDIDRETGALIGRNEPAIGKVTLICPTPLGIRSWGHGSYSPVTGLWYTAAFEFCNNVEVLPIEPTLGGFAYDASDDPQPPPGGPEARLDARDPITGEVRWTVAFKYPPLGSALSTAGGLVFFGEYDGMIHAFNAETGKILWSFNAGSGLRSGIISYRAKGEQYVLVPTGMGGFSHYYFDPVWPELVDFPSGAALFAFKLKR